MATTKEEAEFNSIFYKSLDKHINEHSGYFIDLYKDDTALERLADKFDSFCLPIKTAFKKVMKEVLIISIIISISITLSLMFQTVPLFAF